MNLYLGVDGGGSGCRAAVADGQGRVLGRGTAGPANIATDPEEAARNIRAAATAALVEAGIGAGNGAGNGDGALAGVGLGLAGVNALGAADRLRPLLPWPEARIETDAVTATLGALGEADGVVAALGTGSVFALRRAGRVRQVGGWGLAVSDEGSGAWIGRALLAEAVMAGDGRAPTTPLLAALLAEFGGPQGIAAFAAGAAPTDFAALAPRGFAAEDPAAMAVLDRADAAIAAAIDHLQEGAALPVVLTGGLGPAFAPRLAGRWPLLAPRGTALDGALRLARGMA